ncbi:cysteine-rich receptor-like protein kinase 26 [Chenopodium quinoa]|uniref:cysteine-rich receptor-like protein kinase 26 n=1 Tax=Chenopodium quinoa TaxID=63459 RepID=UPI000B787C9C|nr:cysteine-rich receptor-like protein kinase 26 [Chenopodium quinoa]
MVSSPFHGFHVTCFLVIFTFCLNCVSSTTEGTKEFIVRKDYICDDTKGTYTSNGTFSSNLKLAFSNLTTLSSSRIFSNITIGSDAADNVYALYDCRNDISLDLCHRCIEDAIKSILDLCNDQPKEAIVFYEECMLRYANRMIFSTMELTPNYTNCDLVYYTNRDIKEAIKSTLKSLVDEATKESKSSSYYFASKPMIRIVDSFCLYCVSSITQATEEEFVRNDWECDDTKGTYTSNGTFSLNLKLAFSNLTALSSSRIFSNVTVGSDDDEANKVYALYDCRNDIPLDKCHRCIEDAIESILDLCNDQPKEAIVIYEECMLRYANRTIFSAMELTPNYTSCALEYYTNRMIKVAIKSNLETLMSKATKEGSSLLSNFATKYVSDIVGDRFFYFLVQCTPDLSKVECKECLTDALNFTVDSCASYNRLGGQIKGPSCQMRYDVKRFFNVSSSDYSSTPMSSKSKAKLSFLIVIICVVFVFALLVKIICRRKS